MLRPVPPRHTALFILPVSCPSRTPFADQYHSTAAFIGLREILEVPLDTPVVCSLSHTARGGRVSTSYALRQREAPASSHVEREARCWRDWQGMDLA